MPPQAGYVYLIGSSTFGWFKIGKSSSPEARVRQLGILLPFKVELFALWSSKDCGLVESLMHRKYSDKSINGEWFLFDHTELQHVICDAQPYDAKRTYQKTEDCPAPFYFSNPVSDKIGELGNPAIVHNAMHRGTVNAYMREHGIENTKDNRKKLNMLLSKATHRHAKHLGFK